MKTLIVLVLAVCLFPSFAICHESEQADHYHRTMTWAEYQSFDEEKQLKPPFLIYHVSSEIKWTGLRFRIDYTDNDKLNWVEMGLHKNGYMLFRFSDGKTKSRD